MEDYRQSTIRLLGVVLLAVAALFDASTCVAETVNVDVTATINQTITATKTADFEFGDIELAPTGPSTIQVNASAGALAGVAPTLITGDSLCPTVTSGQVTVEAPFDMDIAVAWPGGDQITLTNGGAGSIVLSAITANSTTLTGGVVAHTGGVPTLLNIGGLLTLPATTPTGSYTGTITVTLTYQ